MTDRLDDIPRTSFAFSANEGCALRDAPKGLTKVLTPTNEGYLEGVFVDVVLEPKMCVRFESYGRSRRRDTLAHQQALEPLIHQYNPHRSIAISAGK
jgi:hypothetical protein